jgi:hypothetical protein
MFLSVDGGCYRISSSSTSQEARRRCFLELMVGAPRSPASVTPRGPPSTFFTLMMGAPGSLLQPGGGCCWTHWQCRQGGPPSMSSSTLVVAAAGPVGSTPRAHHRHLLQPRWWPLSDPPTTLPRGPPSTSSSNMVVDAAGLTGSAP